jgi:type IV secretion system protein VirB9
MKRSAVLAALLLCSAAAPALALDTPAPGREDSHVRTVAYSQFNRTLIVGTVGRVTNITFSPAERIKRVVMGVDNGPIVAPDPKKLGPSPLLNNLFLRCEKTGSADLLAITLLPDGSERTYQFLVRIDEAPKDGSDEADAIYGLVFTYPREEKAVAQQQAAAAWKARNEAEQKRAAEARLATDVFYGVRNWKYVAQGTDRALAPYEVSDNGRLTAFRYPGNTDVPTIYTVDASGAEHATRPEAKDDMLAVPQTAEHFRLRLGRRVLEIYNRGYDPIGQNPGTGTSSPDVVRTVVSGR